MNRRLLIAVAIAVAGVALGWALMSTLSRTLRDPEPPPAANSDAQQTTPSPVPAVPRITALLFFGSEDGRGLVAVKQEVPLAEGRVAQARALVEAQIAAAAPAPLVATIPSGAALRGLYISEKNEAFVDLGAGVRAGHPGGSMNELLTIYTIVNVITSNVVGVESVQLLIDGREVDTLVGHIDLRRPLRKNDALLTP